MDKTEAVISSAYLPPIQYIDVLLKHKTVYIEKHETYPKQTYRNRCEIYSANGLLPLIIPIERPNGNSTKIADVRIDNTVKWRKEHWRAIVSAYKNSAYFEFVMDYFAPFYENDWDFLWDYNTELLSTILRIFDLNINIIETEEFIKQYPLEIDDFRYKIKPKSREIQVDTNVLNKPYFQVFSIKSGFLPNLSILDILCNCGIDSLRYFHDIKCKKGGD
jgi:hypothetical protein